MLAGFGLASEPSPTSEKPTALLRVSEKVADRYVIVGLLVRRDNVTLYVARDELLERQVVLKVLRLDGPEELAMEIMRLELVLARALSHPNICRVHDLIQWKTRPILVMAAASQTLRQRIEAWSTTGWAHVDEIRGIFNEMTSALTMIHSQGLVHGALNPDNILMQGDEPRMLFGPATTRESLIIGTGSKSMTHVDRSYFSPDRLTDGHTSRWDDVYAMGLLLWELLARIAPQMGVSPTTRPMLSKMPAAVAVELSVEELRMLFDALSDVPTQRPLARKFVLHGRDQTRTPRTPVAGTIPAATRGAPFVPNEQALLVTFASDSGNVGNLYPLGIDKLVIGRVADIAIRDRTLSKRHAELEWHDGVWQITDLESTNGTYVDHSYESRDQALVRHGEEIQLGEVRLRLVSFGGNSVRHWQARRELKRCDGLTGFLCEREFMSENEVAAEFADWTGFGAWVMRFELSFHADTPHPVRLLGIRRAAGQIELLTLRWWPGCATFGIPRGRSDPKEQTVLGAVVVGRSRDEPHKLVERIINETRRLLPLNTVLRGRIFRREYGESIGETVASVLA